MKKAILSLSFMVFLLGTSFAQNAKFTVKDISKKWMLDKYKVFYFTEKPSAKEKKDYIHLKSNMTFTSISEGIYETGKWEMNASRSRIILTKSGVKGKLTFIVKSIEKQRLVLTIDDPSDDDAQYLEIHFKTL